MTLWMGIVILIIVSGLVVLGVTWRYFGLTGNFQLAKPNGLLLILGVGLLITGLVMFMMEMSRLRDRQELDEALVEMFGRAPDRLDLEGDRLDSFQGVAHYTDKKYRIEVRAVGLPQTEASGIQTRTIQNYTITATPIAP